MSAEKKEASKESMDSNSSSYENLNVDFIKCLCGEGFSRPHVIRALGISRGDLDMAREILQEFSNPSDKKSKESVKCESSVDSGQ